jgi:hypothetical protein
MVDNMLNVLPTGEGKIVKKTKYGIYVKFPSEAGVIFIPYSETFTDPDLWGEDKSNNS